MADLAFPLRVKLAPMHSDRYNQSWVNICIRTRSNRWCLWTSVTNEQEAKVYLDNLCKKYHTTWGVQLASSGSVEKSAQGR